jgi:hypothetical protein
MKEKCSICKITPTMYFMCGGIDSDLSVLLEVIDKKLFFIKK